MPVKFGGFRVTRDSRSVIKVGRGVVLIQAMDIMATADVKRPRGLKCPTKSLIAE